MASAATFYNLSYFPRAVSFFEESRHAQILTSRLRSGHILARRWFAKGGLEAHADAYIRYLTENGYAVPTVECYFRCVAHFLHWAVQQHAAFHDVGDALIDRFPADRASAEYCFVNPPMVRARTGARNAVRAAMAMTRR